MRAARSFVVSAKRPFVAGLLVVLLAVGGVVGGIAPAATAAGGPGDYLQIDKTVDKPTPLPGDTFTYTVKVTCSEQDCLGALLWPASSRHQGKGRGAFGAGIRLTTRCTAAKSTCSSNSLAGQSFSEARTRWPC